MVKQNRIIRVITRAPDGSIREKEFESVDNIAEMHEQIGIDDCSTDLALRGLPIFRGLVGPLPEGKTAIRYESPEVFETLTKEWSKKKVKRRRRRKPAEIENTNESIPRPNMLPTINMPTSTTSSQTNT